MMFSIQVDHNAVPDKCNFFSAESSVRYLSITLYKQQVPFSSGSYR